MCVSDPLLLVVVSVPSQRPAIAVSEELEALRLRLIERRKHWAERFNAGSGPEQEIYDVAYDIIDGFIDDIEAVQKENPVDA